MVISIWQNLKYLALLTQVGLSVIIPMIGALYIGNYLQTIFDLPGLFVIALALLGLLGGLFSAYKLLTKWWKL